MILESAVTNLLLRHSVTQRTKKRKSRSHRACLVKE